MIKKIIFLLFIGLTLTGCSLYKVNDLSNDGLVDQLLVYEGKKANYANRGYKFYLPKDMTVIGDQNNNVILYSFNEKYYFYVDLISYYTKNSNEYKINTDRETIYSKTLDYNGKNGYILVTSYHDQYFVEVMYHYAKIEVITNDYKTAIAKSLVVLNSITYNDKIIESLIGENILSYGEEIFQLLAPSSPTTDFLKYGEDYGIYEDIDNELPDEDKIDIKNKE